MEIPFTTYPHLCLLQERHAVELGQTCRNDKACKDFIVAISDQFKNKLGEQLQRVQFLGVMTDSATDVGVREVEDVYVHYLKDRAPVNTFVGLRPGQPPKPRVSLKLLTVHCGNYSRRKKWLPLALMERL